MSKNSKQLQAFIKNDFKKLLKRTKFSDISITFIETLFLRMKEGFESFKNTVLKEELLDLRRTFPKGPDYSHISQEIRDIIENSIKIGKKFEFLLADSLGNPRVIRVHFILPMEKVLSLAKQSLFIDSCMEHLKMIYTWFFMATSFASPSCSRDLDIYLYLTNHTKVLPKDNKIMDGELTDISIGQIHSNSAFTFSCNREHDTKENDIYIYRFEEWSKVLIHESFHSLGLDFSSTSQKDIDPKIRELYDVETDPRFYETYTETWAEILNAMFIVYLSKDKRMDSHKKQTELFIRRLEDFIELEQLFSMFQCAKVLHHYGLTYREFVSKDSISSEKRHRLYNEKTHVLAYYIMKSVFLWNSEDFVEWCAIKNRGSLQFYNKRNIIDLVGLLQQLYKSPKYMKTIEAVEKIFDKKSTEVLERTTLRMTLLEI